MRISIRWLIMFDLSSLYWWDEMNKNPKDSAVNELILLYSKLSMFSISISFADIPFYSKVDNNVWVYLWSFSFGVWDEIMRKIISIACTRTVYNLLSRTFLNIVRIPFPFKLSMQSFPTASINASKGTRWISLTSSI